MGLVALFLFLMGQSAVAQIETGVPSSQALAKRSLKALYKTVNDQSPGQIRVESQDLVLKDYNLIVTSATWWNGAEQTESLWEKISIERSKELNVIVIYDAPKQDVQKIKSKSPSTKLYEYFDQNRAFYYWFQNPSLTSAVLIGPKGDILFEGLLHSEEALNQMKSLVKKREP